MVAIILVNYNGADDTIECIESLKGLTDDDHKIIVVDNKSTDDSEEKLKKSRQKYDFVLLTSNDNKGFSAGNNAGILYAKEKYDPDYYWLLNNDTIVQVDTLSELLNGFKMDSPDTGITTAKIYYEKDRSMIWYAGGSFNFKTGRTEHWNYGMIEQKKPDNEIDRDVTFASGCCMLIPKNVIRDVGLLNESYFLYEEDTDYCIRTQRKGYKIRYCPNAVLYHKVSASTGVASPVSQFYSIRNKYMLISKHFKGINKAIAYLYTTAQMLNRCIKREVNFKHYIEATRAFLKKDMGKTSVAIK